VVGHDRIIKPLGEKRRAQGLLRGTVSDDGRGLDSGHNRLRMRIRASESEHEEGRRGRASCGASVLVRDESVVLMARVST